MKINGASKMSKGKNLPEYYSYTAVFTKDRSGFWIAAFPDLDGCETNAKTLEEAIIQAHNILEDYMAILERDEMDIPAPTPFERVKISAEAVTQRVAVSMKGARKRWAERAVNRMVTLPAWLDEKGREANLNFSQILQMAVTHELGLKGISE
jgi:predicted RNase H-like HicB family nuclease